MRSPLRVCADPARKCSGLDDASTSHGNVGLCPMHCLLCTACPACDVVLLNALLCVHGAHACLLSRGVLLMLACSCRFSLTTLAGLHVAMLFEWCVQAFPSGHVGPPATAGNKRRLGKGLQKRRPWHGRNSSQEVEVCLVHVMCYACVDRLCHRAAYFCRIHR
jgi:hypothetical protein